MMYVKYARINYHKLNDGRYQIEARANKDGQGKRVISMQADTHQSGQVIDRVRKYAENQGYKIVAIEQAHTYRSVYDSGRWVKLEGDAYYTWVQE